jgi:hypothetical protein
MLGFLPPRCPFTQPCLHLSPRVGARMGAAITGARVGAVVGIGVRGSRRHDVEATLAAQIWLPARLLLMLLPPPSDADRFPMLPTSSLPLARDARQHSSLVQELGPCRSSWGWHGEEKELTDTDDCHVPLPHWLSRLSSEAMIAARWADTSKRYAYYCA